MESWMQEKEGGGGGGMADGKEGRWVLAMNQQCSFIFGRRQKLDLDCL